MNEAPRIELDPTTATIVIGSGVERPGRVTDDGPGPLTATIHDGGNAPPRPLELADAVALVASGGSAGAARQRLAASFMAYSSGMAMGQHTVMVTVCDAEQACSSASFQVQVVDQIGGVPTAATPTTTTTTTVDAPAAPSPPAPAQNPVTPGGGLPATGGNPVGVVFLGLLGVAAGTMCLALARRRSRPVASR